MHGSQFPHEKSIKYKNHFKKNIKRLPPEIKAQLEALCEELVNANLSQGRHLEKVYDNTYTARLNINYRLAFEIHNNDAFELFAIGTHDHVYRYLNRTRTRRKAEEHKQRKSRQNDPPQK